MNKNVKDRAEYVQNRVDSVRNKRTEINKIAKELFLSTRTIVRDLNKNIDTTTK